MPMPAPVPVPSLPQASSASSAAVPKALCKRCHVREVGMLFLPCSHACACKECGEAAQTCYECRMPITFKVPIKL